MKRIDELRKSVDNDTTYYPLIDHIVSLEKELDRLKKLPHIRVHPSNPELQKATPAAKQYKEYLQQYLNAIKVLTKVIGKENESEDSPLREWIRSQNVDM